MPEILQFDVLCASCNDAETLKHSQAMYGTFNHHLHYHHEKTVHTAFVDMLPQLEMEGTLTKPRPEKARDS
jgi:hypothetical protein